MTTSAYKLASVLLQYPTMALFDGLDWTRVQTMRTIPQPTVAV